MISKSNILFPCYIYPSPGAWEPLYQAVNFTVVVNPFNGPGLEAIPDTCYQHEIAILAKFDNVHLIGYVHTSYASRDISILEKEIKIYSGWSENSGIPRLAVEGLFVDEVPWQYDEKVADYLQDISDIIMFNPGCVPDPRHRAKASADVTVMFEDTYETFKLRQANNTFKAIKGDQDRSELACVVHSIPAKLTDEEYHSLVRQVRELAGEVFLTDQNQGYYNSFSAGWTRFVQAMAS